MNLPRTIMVILFEGAPVSFAYTTDEAREYLGDVFEDSGELYQVHQVHNDTSMPEDVTAGFAAGWADDGDFGVGDDPDEFLKPFPGFVLAHCREQLIDTYRQAQEERDHNAFERSKVRSL